MTEGSNFALQQVEVQVFQHRLLRRLSTLCTFQVHPEGNEPALFSNKEKHMQFEFQHESDNIAGDFIYVTFF